MSGVSFIDVKGNYFQLLQYGGESDSFFFFYHLKEVGPSRNTQFDLTGFMTTKEDHSAQRQ